MNSSENGEKIVHMQHHISNLPKESRYKLGKSFHKYCFTLEDIARVKGKSLSTVRNDKWNGKFDPDDIKSVAKYILR